MADIMGMDELETFVLDFLAYRREQRMKMQTPQNHVPRRIECKSEPSTTQELEYIPPAKVVPIENRPGRAETANASTRFSTTGRVDLKRNDYIGKGWPHYKNTQAAGLNKDLTPLALASQSDIVPALAPVVAQVLARFGPPTSQKALDHLINQVIASAMELPLVSESIQTSEIKPWGRVALLQAVIELLIRISTM